MLEELQAVKPNIIDEEDTSGSRTVAKSERTRTLLIPLLYALAEEDVGYKPSLGVSDDEQEIKMEILLEKELFTGNKSPPVR